jgi:hypothetical protein
MDVASTLEQEKLLRLVVESYTTYGHRPRGTRSEPDHLLRAIDGALTKAESLMSAVP